MTPTGLLTVGAHTITPAPSKAAELAVFRTFVMAHLLTADREQAEAASLEAIDAWNPETESGEALLRHGVDDALRRTHRRVPPDPIESGAARSYLPAELQAVLKLPPSHRRCFALRALGGFSSVDCAQLLHLPPSAIEKYTRSAVVRLANLSRSQRKEELMNSPVEFKTIENLAYHLWMERGCPHGSPNEDWFLAERELCLDRAKSTSTSSLRLPPRLTQTVKTQLTVR